MIVNLIHIIKIRKNNFLLNLKLVSNVIRNYLLATILIYFTLMVENINDIISNKKYFREFSFQNTSILHIIYFKCNSIFQIFSK